MRMRNGLVVVIRSWVGRLHPSVGHSPAARQGCNMAGMQRPASAASARNMAHSDDNTGLETA